MQFDPGITREWPLLVFFATVVGAFLLYLERKDKRYQDALDKRDALVQKLSDSLEAIQEKQDNRWISFFTDQQQQWRGFIREVTDRSDEKSDLTAQRLQELGGIIQTLIQRFDQHDQRTRGSRNG